MVIGLSINTTILFAVFEIRIDNNDNKKLINDY